jgi:hypothetical protein
MKLSALKTKKIVQLFVSLAAAAIMMTVCTVVASAAGGGTGTTPAATGSEAAYQATINFFITWIRRIGMMVAFVGAIMFALANKNEDAERKTAGLITMVAGFIVAALCAASSMFDLFG